MKMKDSVIDNNVNDVDYDYVKDEKVKFNGFSIPRKDADELRLNDFIYDADAECFKGYLEDHEGGLCSYEYYPTNNLWLEVAVEPDDFSGASEGDR